MFSQAVDLESDPQVTILVRGGLAERSVGAVCIRPACGTNPANYQSCFATSVESPTKTGTFSTDRYADPVTVTPKVNNAPRNTSKVSPAVRGPCSSRRCAADFHGL